MNKTISELIAELQALQAIHGNLPVFVSVYTGGDTEQFDACAQLCPYSKPAMVEVYGDQRR